MPKPAPGVIDRPYFSSWLLWSAEHHAELARHIEAGRTPGERYPYIEHRAYVLSSIIASAAFLEAMVNEIFQDVAEGYDHFGATAHLSEPVRARLLEVWERTDGGRRGPTLGKYEALAELDHESGVYKDASLLIDVRNAIVHYRPKDGFTAKQARTFEARLRRRLKLNPLRSNILRAWWPDYALGSDFAFWAVRSATGLADYVCSAAGVDADYRKHRGGTWFDWKPGRTELGGQEYSA
jgi:hypothetical protein